MRLCSMLALLLLAPMGAVAHASTNQLTYTGTVSGSYGGTNFSDAAITITGTYDPSTVITNVIPDVPTFQTVNSVLSFTIAGVGSGTISDGSIFINSSGVAGVEDQDNDFLDLSSSAFYNLGANLVTPFAAVSGGTANSGSTTASGGTLDITDASNLSFGISSASISTTPEPGSLVLLGTGLLGMAGVARRRFVA